MTSHAQCAPQKLITLGLVLFVVNVLFAQNWICLLLQAIAVLLVLSLKVAMKFDLDLTAPQ